MPAGSPRYPKPSRALAARWRLTSGRRSIRAGSAPGSRPPAPALVLKVGWTHDEARDEAVGLRAWDGRGAVRLLAEHRAGETTALLLERVVPGSRSPRCLGPSRTSCSPGCCGRLWIEPPAGIRSLLRDVRRLGRRGGARLAGLDPGLVREALALFRALPRDDVTAALLATDLHAGNVLAARREPWLMIDPKPYAGDPAYDVTQHLLNDPARLTTDPRGFARRVADLAGLDADRVTAWLFARSVVEAGDWPYDTRRSPPALRT